MTFSNTGVRTLKVTPSGEVRGAEGRYLVPPWATPGPACYQMVSLQIIQVGRRSRGTRTPPQQ
jgi:hypothetical protein